MVTSKDVVLMFVSFILNEFVFLKIYGDIGR